MTDRDNKIKHALDEVNLALTRPTQSVYDAVMSQNYIIKLLSDLYEAGRVEGELSKIKDTE